MLVTLTLSLFIYVVESFRVGSGKAFSVGKVASCGQPAVERLKRRLSGSCVHNNCTMREAYATSRYQIGFV